MILKSFRIKNYKSFLDSGNCSVQDGVTILAGQNESGKTNILSALTKINDEVPTFSKEEYSFDIDESPEIVYNFELSKDEVLSLNEFTSALKIRPDLSVVIRDGVKTLNLDYTVVRSVEDDELQRLKDDIDDRITEMLPNFILYKTTEDDLPDSFTAQELSKNAIKRLSKYLDQDFSKIFASKSHQEQQNMTKKLSREISTDFSSKYRQKEVRIEFQINSSTLTMYIQDINPKNKESGYSFKISQRSRGLCWYLNFYIALKGENLKPGDIILVDEPGIYLHPKAQQEMREILNNESKSNQIIYTTHSPYLIDTDNIGQVRLVEKEGTTEDNPYNEESKIRERVHHSRNIDSLKPIVDAIGYSLGSELNLQHKKILICEGVSDYYYIKALQNILGKALSCGITHANGCNNIDKITSLYLGLGISEIFALVDSDTAGVKKRNSLIREGAYDEAHIFTTHDNVDNDSAIEDIFSREWYLKNILEYDNANIKKADTKLSKELKKVKGGAKYVSAKCTFDMSAKGNLDKDVVLDSSAIALFEKLEKAINGN